MPRDHRILRALLRRPLAPRDLLGRWWACSRLCCGRCCPRRRRTPRFQRGETPAVCTTVHLAAGLILVVVDRLMNRSYQIRKGPSCPGRRHGRSAAEGS